MRPTGRGVASGEHLDEKPAPTPVAPQQARRSGETPRSDYGSVPGTEFPVAVYVSVFAAFAWILVASWLAFANGDDADLALGFAAVLTIVFFALPVIVRLTAAAHSREPQGTRNDFLSSRVETATGSLTGASAWLQVLIIPVALALAATLIGVTSVLVH
jgi:hypothetical protein